MPYSSEISVPEIELESLPELDLGPYSLEVNSSLRDRTPRLNEDDLSGNTFIIILYSCRRRYKFNEDDFRFLFWCVPSLQTE